MPLPPRKMPLRAAVKFEVLHALLFCLLEHPLEGFVHWRTRKMAAPARIVALGKIAAEVDAA